MKFKTPIAYTKLDKQKHLITEEALRNAIKKVKLPLPISPNFNMTEAPIGKVIDLNMENNKLVATMEITNVGVIKLLDKSCFRLGFISKKDQEKEGYREFQNIEILDIAFVSKINDVYDEKDK